MESFQIFLICFDQFIDHRVDLRERADRCCHRIQLYSLIDVFIPALNHGLCHLLMNKDIGGVQGCKLIRQITYITGMNSEVTIKNGRDRISGIIRGIDELGRLILERNDQKLYISSGDMFINEKEIVVNYD